MARVTKIKQILKTKNGEVVSSSQMNKLYRDTLIDHHGHVEEIVKKKTVHVTTIDLDDPIGGKPLSPGKSSPLCSKCELCEMRGRNPFLPPSPVMENPDILIVTDGVSKSEDMAGEVGTEGQGGYVRKAFDSISKQVDIRDLKIQVVAMTRCGWRAQKPPNLKSKGNYCRNFLVDYIRRNTPKLIVPVGTTPLGLLCHKSNAADWGGRVLTYRGWPDDWLTNPAFVLPRKNKKDPEIVYPAGHPLFGPKPGHDKKIPMIPIQSPRLVFLTQNQNVINRWNKHIGKILTSARDGIVPNSYTRPWYKLTTDPNVVLDDLQYLIDNPGTLVTYDTETTGLRQWADNAAIVFMMFRWADKDGNPHALGFPWDYESSPLKPYIKDLSPFVLEVLYKSRLRGHNLTFDILYSYANIKGANLESLTSAMHSDTLHMAYTLKQQRGSLGLDHLMYDWVPELAGYEEELTLLIELHPFMNPEHGGHYANCPVELWDTSFKPYVMGDVEGCHLAGEAIAKKLSAAKTYKIPLANTVDHGKFRWFQPPSREFVYDKIMLPSSRMLTRMMGRGLHVNMDEVKFQENYFPNALRESITKMRNTCPEVVSWCEQMEATVPGWELDLGNPTLLKELLYRVLRLKIQRITKTGKKLYGDAELDDIPQDELYQYAAIDKYTLNKLAVDHEQVRPLQEYKKLFKQYSGYVRPMRNSFDADFDKDKKKGLPLLLRDSMVHGQFLLTGTRGGRLSSRNPNLQNLSRDGIIKRMYDSRFGKRGCLFQGDLSQIELRLLAAACGDPAMVKAYIDDIDLHSQTASWVFKKQYECYTKDYMQKLEESGKADLSKGLDTQRKIAKCVDPDTLITINNRIVRMSSLRPKSVKPDTFYDVDYRIQIPKAKNRFQAAEVRQFYYNGIDKKILVCARHGIIACSRTHKLMLSNGKFVMAKDLVKGDVLAEVERHVSPSDVKEIPFNPHAVDVKTEQYSIKIDTDMAYFMGMFMGDGCSSEVSVSIAAGNYGKYLQWQKSIRESLKKVGFIPRVKKEAAGGKVYNHVHFGSNRVSDILIQMGLLDSRRKKILKIPEYLFNTPIDVKIAFLAGMIDTDGCVSADGHVSICTKSWTLAQDLLVLARSVNIECSVHPMWNKKYERYYYDIGIKKKCTPIFKPLLRCHWKKSRVKTARFLYRNPRYKNQVIATVPLPDGELMDVEVKTTEHAYIANGLVSHNCVNFLTGYGGGAFGLQTALASQGIYLPIEECEEMLERFFSAYPTLKRYLGAYKHFIEQNGVAVSILGRVRIFEEVFSDDREQKSKALRAGCNHLIQSTASDMMLICLNVIEHYMREYSLESILVSTVHDSLLIDAVVDELPTIYGICSEVLNNIPGVLKFALGNDYDTSWMILPFSGDFEVSKNYLDMRKVPTKGDVDWDKLLSPKAKEEK